MPIWAEPELKGAPVGNGRVKLNISPAIGMVNAPLASPSARPIAIPAETVGPMTGSNPASISKAKVNASSVVSAADQLNCVPVAVSPT